jgi:hypothetical protein
MLVVAGAILSWPALGCRETGAAIAGIQNITCLGRFAVDRGRPIGSIDGLITSDGRPFLISNLPGLQVAIDYGESVSIYGWAIDSDARQLASRVIWRVDSTALPATYGKSRPDVVKVIGLAALLRSGYNIKIPTVYLPPGPHLLSCYVVNASTLRAQAFPDQIIVSVAQPAQIH